MEIPLLDTVDLEILMHRDAHFGRNFSIMLEYYEKDGVGVMPDFSIDRIKQLAKMQDDAGVDLSLEVMPMPASERVANALDYYKKFQGVYEESAEIPKIISDLILSEEEHPEKEIAATVSLGSKAVDALIHMIDGSDFYDELYPGYGRAPALAAICLGKIGDEKAIYHLFQAIGKANFFVDDEIIKALVAFKESGKEFLLKRLLEKPISHDNLSAAAALSSFPLDGEIAAASFTLLLELDLSVHENLASYLVCMCEGLSSDELRKTFATFAAKAPESLKNEMRMILSSWS